MTPYPVSAHISSGLPVIASLTGTIAYVQLRKANPLPTSLVDAVDSIIVGFDGVDSLVAILSAAVRLVRFSGSSSEYLTTKVFFLTEILLIGDFFLIASSSV